MRDEPGGEDGVGNPWTQRKPCDIRQQQGAARLSSTRPVGNWSFQTLRPVYASALRFAARYAAKKTASRILANSPG
ncbi:hypothetical protein DLE01_27980, partial [Streptomyces sp. FT05W]